MAIEKTYRFRLEIANEQQFKQALEKAMPDMRRAFTGTATGTGGGGLGDNLGNTLSAFTLANRGLANTIARLNRALQPGEGKGAIGKIMGALGRKYDRESFLPEEEREATKKGIYAAAREKALGNLEQYIAGVLGQKDVLTPKEEQKVLLRDTMAEYTKGLNAQLRAERADAEASRTRWDVVKEGVGAVQGRTTRWLGPHIGGRDATGVQGLATMAGTRLLLGNIEKLGKAMGDLADVTGDVRMGIVGRSAEALGGWAGATAVGAYVGSLGGPIGTVIGSLIAGGAAGIGTHLGLRGEEEKLRLTQAAEDYATEGTLSAIAREGKVLALTLRRASATHEEELHAIDREIAAANETTRGRRDMARAIADATRATERMTRGQRASAQLWVDTAGVHLSDEMAAYSRTMALSRRYGARGKVDPDAMAEKLLQANEARYQAMLGQLIDERNLSGMLQNEFQVRKAAIEAVRENTARQIKQQAEDDRHANALYRANEELTTTAVRATAMQKLVIEYQRRNLHGMDDDLNLSRMSAEVWKMLRDEGQRLIEGQPRGRLGIESLWEEATRARNELSFSDMQKAVDRLIPVLMKNSGDGTQIMQRLLDAVNDIRRERGNTYDP